MTTAVSRSPAPPPASRTSAGSRLELCQVSKRFDERSVLKTVDLSARPGEFVAIVGRSGCGKSTLLRLVAGLEAPTSGSIQVDDEVVRGVRRGTRVMFQDSRLLPWRTVRQNVALGLDPSGARAVERILANVGLADRGDEWPAVLSGGQRQRVALARALVAEPRLLLLDEPLGSLDALTRLEMQSLVHELWREREFTALLVTHDVEEAVFLADRIILLDDGTVGAEFAVDLPRPRERSSVAFASLTEAVLSRVMRHDAGDQLLDSSPS